MRIPGVYARVSVVVDWIRHLTSEGVSCQKPTDPTQQVFTSTTPTRQPITKQSTTRITTRRTTVTRRTTPRPNITRKPTTTATSGISCNVARLRAIICAGWGEWTEFSGCDAACGIGKKSRDRFCHSGCKHTQQTQERVCRIRIC